MAKPLDELIAACTKAGLQYIHDTAPPTPDPTPPPPPTPVPVPPPPVPVPIPPPISPPVVVPPVVPPAPVAGSITYESFVRLGGWRVPPAPDQYHNTITYTPGGLNYAPAGGFFIPGHTHSQGAPQMFGNAVVYGDPASDPSTWPQLIPLGPVKGLATPGPGSPNGSLVRGCLQLKDGRYLSSHHGSYATTPLDWDANFLSLSDGTYVPWSDAAGGFGRQKFGGNLGRIPKVLQPLFGGRTLYSAGMGCLSGQESSAGPSCVVFNEDLTGPVEVLGFGNFKTTDPTLRQTRPPDYSVSPWGTPLPINGIGYWVADQIWWSCMLPWGLLVLVRQGTGSDISYLPNVPSLDVTPAYRIGLVPADRMAAAFRGEIRPNEAGVPIGGWSPWPWTDKSADMTITTRGMCWDDDQQLAYLMQSWAWSDYGVEWYPRIDVCRVVPAAPVPAGK